MSTTTSQFQTKPDYFNSIEDCNKSFHNKQQTNLRYRNFTQTHFTAGDEEQFQHYRYDKNGDLDQPTVSLEENIFKDYENEYWDGYKDLEATNVLETFRYLFNKFKKGIFVKIVNNKLKVFLPFSNVNFVNEWSHNIKIDPKYGNLYDFIKYTNELEGRTFNKNNVNDFTNTWYGNNCLVRYEYPIRESDTNIPNIKNILEELCLNRKIPDIEFFVNRRDFPLLTKNGSEPYFHLWNSLEYPLISHKYEKYVPILSMSKMENYADIMIPSHEDWGRVQVKENKFFCKSHINFEYDFNSNWESKKSIAVFRGSSTGYGLDIETNQRLKVAYLSTIYDTYIDAGITKWNTRPRKFMDNMYLQTIDVDKLPFGLVNKLTPLEQSNYKYIIHIEGHVSAFRLSYELNMNSVILLVDSDWKLWYSDMLKPYVHYIPVKKDLSDLIDIIKWCRNNDGTCKEIVNNAKKFYNKYLTKTGIFDFMQKLFVDLKKHTGTYLYNSIKPIDLQLKEEYSIISKLSIKNTSKTVNENSILPNIKRSYGFLKGIHNAINTLSDTEKQLLPYDEKIFHNKLGTIDKKDFLGFKLAVKNTKDDSKKKEHIHETFIGLTCINELLKDIPNFVYNFGKYEYENSINVMTEHIEGQTFQEYINSESFCVTEYIFILLQICLVLSIAQKKFCFVHNDLTPWNIIIKKLKEPITIDYLINYKKIIRVKTNIVPILIDYGKSHVIYDNTHYGFINMYKFSSVTDILSLLITSIYQIITEKQLNKNDFNYILKLANFMANTTYRKEYFTNSKDLKKFLYNMKKYSNLITENKHELESQTPIDLFNYIRKNIRYKYDICGTNEYISFMNYGNANQILDFITSDNREDRLQSYINFFDKLKTEGNFVSNNNNLLLTYYTANSLYENIKSVGDQMISYAKTEVLYTEKYANIISNMLKFIENSYKSKINRLKIQDIPKIKIADPKPLQNYNEDIFLCPDKVQKLLSIYKFNDVTIYKHILEFLLCTNNNFKLKESEREWCFKNLDRLLSLDDVHLKVYNANNNTIRKITKIIYTKNIENIKNPEQLEKYTNVLNLLK